MPIFKRQKQIDYECEVITMFFFGFNAFPGLKGIFMLPLAIIAAIWTWRDAAKLGKTPWIWSAIAFSIFPIGFFVYLGFRVLTGKNKL